jgi:hypothetical protein
MRPVNWTGNPDSSADHAAALYLRLSKDLAEHSRRGIQCLAGLTIDVHFVPVLAKQVVAKVGDRNPDVAMPEVNADHDPRRIPQHELNSGPPAVKATALSIHV